jgi:hypothetical protein
LHRGEILLGPILWKVQSGFNDYVVEVLFRLYDRPDAKERSHIPLPQAATDANPPGIALDGSIGAGQRLPIALCECVATHSEGFR